MEHIVKLNEAASRAGSHGAYAYIVFTITLMSILYVSPFGRQGLTVLSAIDYIVAGLAILAFLLKPKYLRNNLILTLGIVGALSIFSESLHAKKIGIFGVYLLILSVTSVAFQNRYFSNRAIAIFVKMSALIIIAEVFLLYVLANPFDVDSMNEFVANGIEYGFNKGTVALFMVLPIFYFLAARKYLYFSLLIIYCLPVLLSMRMGMSAFAMTVLVYFGTMRGWSAQTLFAASWSALMGATITAIIFGDFDRLPTYMIAWDVISSKNLMGLGIFQYPEYVQNNQSLLFDNFSSYISIGFNEIWNSGESLFGELLASLGLGGCAIILQYLVLMYSQFKNISKYEPNHAAMAMLYMFIIFSGLAHDYSKLGFQFYLICGAVIGLSSHDKFKEETILKQHRHSVAA